MRNSGLFGDWTDEIQDTPLNANTNSDSAVSDKSAAQPRVTRETQTPTSDTPAKRSRFSRKNKQNKQNTQPTPTSPAADRARQAKDDYDRATKGVKNKIYNAAAIILGVATAGIAGYSYAAKSIAYKKAVAAAEYNAQIAEIQKDAVEAIHQSAVNALSTGNPLFDYNDYGSSIFPNMDGKFSQFAESNPELADLIIQRVHAHSNVDVLNQYAVDRGFDSYAGFLEWSNSNFSGLFTQNGTISPDATMQQIDAYYYTFVDLYNYLGDEAVSYYADEILQAGIDPSTLQDAQIVVDPFVDASGEVINQWSIDLAPDAVDAMASANLDSTEIVGAIGIAAMAGLGGYYLGSKICDKISSKSSQSEQTK